jgi:TolA-binding protein
MKNLVLLLMVFSIGSLCAQESHSKKEKKYQRYENGELIEDKYYLERDGQAIEGTDFAMPEMDIKMAEMKDRMKDRMKDMQERMDMRMKSKTLDMNNRMEEMMQRSNKMQEDMMKRMNDTNKRMEKQEKPDESSPKVRPPKVKYS